MTFDLKDYRAALGSFATGVTIVTALDSVGNGHGLTVNSFASVSLEPALVLWCLGNKSDSYELFATCTAYGVNILSDDQTDLAMRFAGKGDQRLASGEYGKLATGSPILPGTIAAFDAKVVERINAGDHLILIGETQAYQRHDGNGLAYFRGKFGSTAALSGS
ncbi:p-hydroxyphenylacetate 3-hydroxylase, reductase component [Candidatus Phycosocius bacilliformis]|uniref:p-hydroxyphenylacetate 3-hydroxylase, reductase component n=1 Tax=Candidatus Phycosocius bacilliformis TaxID=1445552 RepID=A0A2P2E836_9PROT|nr:flavin reductase family protein [Candidatus Phycosocius bacilliformis]GBF57228.1 p-hydroxyphenylacetate 3-hydroxylase, reductase component [Candidatus Phycosocius bacilliformis]